MGLLLLASGYEEPPITSRPLYFLLLPSYPPPPPPRLLLSFAPLSIEPPSALPGCRLPLLYPVIASYLFTSLFFPPLRAPTIMASIQAVPQLGGFRIPPIENEPMVSTHSPLLFSSLLLGAPADHRVSAHSLSSFKQRNYEPKSADRAGLQAAVDEMLAHGPYEVPCIVNGKEIKTGRLARQLNPSAHSKALCEYHEADPALVQEAIAGALEAKKSWENMPWNDRAAIFLKAADLIAGKYRFKLMAATMLGQGKNVWQAEIDAAAEVSIPNFHLH